ncbi:hypothetical protein CRUP_023653 [Coryphaenoides rupestris]|nr:hypothetical protein CRUP_023653 [Coryphaenoides rupestris]
MLLASAVVVWEWLNEHGRWRPYSPAVSHHIEAVVRSDPRAASVVLGQVDPRLAPYIVDVHSMHQFRQDTGTLRPVRRSFYDPASAPGQGWQWEWENDAGSWTAYDTEVGIAIQAARDRQQPWLDLAPLGFCYLIDFQSMTQINGQTQRCRRIQRRSDLAYPLVSGPLPKSHQPAWGPGGGSVGPSGLMGIGMSGVGGGLGGGGGVSGGGMGAGTGNGSAYPSGALPASAITSLGQPCACQQCMLVLSVKAGAMSAVHTLGRRPPPNKPPSPKLGGYMFQGGSYSLTLPRPPSLTRTLSPHRTSIIGAMGGGGGGGSGGGGAGTGGTFGHSLSFLGSATAALSLSSTRPPPPPLPPPPPPPAPAHLPSISLSASLAPPPHPSSGITAIAASSSGSASSYPSATTAASVQTLPLISTVASSCAPSPSARVLGPVPSSAGAAACAAPLPPRASLAGLSRPALQRIAMAQSRALIASGAS